MGDIGEAGLANTVTARGLIVLWAFNHERFS